MIEQECTKADARTRLSDAEDFLMVASLADNPNVAASNAVLAGIAAADVICCIQLGRHSRSPDHSKAVKLLREARSRESATQLERLLSIKTKAQYDVQSLTARQAAGALTRSKRLVDAARGMVG